MRDIVIEDASSHSVAGWQMRVERKVGSVMVGGIGLTWVAQPMLREQQATRLLIVEIFSEVIPHSLWRYESVVSHL